jgi:hypothetical protein
MTREFSLVLVGSGILTAGYFLYPEEDVEAKQKEQVEQQVAGNNNNNNNNNQQRHHRTHVPLFLWIHTGAWGSAPANSGARPTAMGGTVSRGGFGSIGRGSVGG